MNSEIEDKLPQTTFFLFDFETGATQTILSEFKL